MVFLKMAEKSLNQTGFEQGRKNKAEYRTIEMGVVVDVVPALLGHVLTVDQVDYAKDDSRNRQDCE